MIRQRVAAATDTESGAVADPHSRHLRWKWLQSFVALVRCGSQAEAARYLGRSQPSVGSHLKHLEAWFGDRLGTGHSPYVLTETGTELLAAIKKTSRNLKRHRTNDAADLSEFKFEWITTFYVLRKYRSQVKSARLLNQTQPSISRKLSELERWLGQSLFERREGWHTTNFGESFFLSSDKILSRFVTVRENARLRMTEENERIDKEIHDWNTWVVHKHFGWK